MNFAHRHLTIAAIFFALAIPAIVLACGPYFTSAIFVAQRPADNTELISGSVGIVRPSFSSEQLFIAYRNLHGEPLNASERAAMSDESNGSSAVSSEEWTTARTPVDPAPTSIDSVKELKNYAFFVNCTSDAFHTAATHLNELIAKNGPASTPVRQWTAAQDLVFQNCSKDAGTPAAPVAQMTPAQRADRLYQIAAANFYSMHYDVAAEQFQAIGHDASSPWREYGVFLAARCYLRKATVGPLAGTPQSTPAGSTLPTVDEESMRKALQLLRQVAADKSLGKVHESTSRLISFAELHVNPDKQMLNLSASLSHPSNDKQLASHLGDYFVLLNSKAAPEDELGQWITAVRQPTPSSIEKWKSRQNSQPWLTAALIAANDKSTSAPELISAALKVNANSPAFVTAQYHAARLRFQRGESAQVRQQIDTLLATRRKQLDASTVAALVVLRSRVASSLADFAQFATLTPTGFSEPEDDASWTPCQHATQSDKACTIPMITPAAAAMINHMPLSTLLQLAALDSASLPIRRSAALIAFERGALLGKFKEADRAALLLSSQSKLDAALLKSYLAANTDEERRFAAAFAILHWPGVTPSLDVSVMRDGTMRELSDYRNNWWSSAQGPKRQSGDDYEYLIVDEAAPRFLADAERTAGEQEYLELGKVGSASIWLPRVVIEWAKTHRDTPQLPEALHLAVNATHLGADTSESSAYSKEAFQLLHRNYPHSSWAEKTKYYY